MASVLDGVLGNNSLGRGTSLIPRGAATRMPRPLDGRRGGFLRADSVENASGGLLDVLQALRQQLGVTLVKLDVILRCRSCLKSDCLADDECYSLGFRLAAAL